MIAVIDVTGNNLTSIGNAIERLGFISYMTHDPKIIEQASHVILPGVGTVGAAMQALQQYQLVEVIRNLTQPLLGICVGMQLLFEQSEEGNAKGLGILPGKVQRLPSELTPIFDTDLLRKPGSPTHTSLVSPHRASQLPRHDQHEISGLGFPIPHMGWNCLEWNGDCSLKAGLHDSDYFYFVHSYAILSKEYSIARAHYSTDFTAIVQKNNIYGVQFHPEKSALVGLTLLNNFLNLKS